MKISSISQKSIPAGEEVKGAEVREGILQMIQKENPQFTVESYLSLQELNRFRRQYLAALILEEKGEQADLDREVMEAIRNNSILSENIQEEIESVRSIGDRISDRVASFGGSWTFIITFFSFILIWIGVNVWMLSNKSFDPYPFILLNLILSCVAAIQAPIIMMSQNRKEQKDRIRSEHDYKINLKAELEIKLLSEKIDHLLVHQNKKLLEIQEMQIDYLEDLMKKK